VFRKNKECYHAHRDVGSVMPYANVTNVTRGRGTKAASPIQLGFRSASRVRRAGRPQVRLLDVSRVGCQLESVRAVLRVKRKLAFKDVKND
jgi:hypothetical protein